jgi:DNA-binding transcriptional LysR family regulator
MLSADLRQLRHFVVLAHTLNYRKAAEQLHMAQPPLSASIRRLEDQLGVQLFERNRRGTALTPAGLTALPHAEMAVHHAREFVQVAKTAAAGERGLVRLGFVGSATYVLLPQLVQWVREALPQVELELSEGPTSSLCAMLRSGDLDAALLRYPVTEATAVRMQPLTEDTLVAALPTGHALCARKRIRLADLRDEPLIQYNPTLVPGLHALMLAACQHAGFQPKSQQHATQVQTMLSLVQAGLGIALVPSVVAHTAVSGVHFVPLTAAGHMSATGIALAWAPERDTPLNLRFRTMLQASLSPGASSTGTGTGTGSIKP